MAQKTTMSITRALATLKSLNTEIDNYFSTPRTLFALKFGAAGMGTSLGDKNVTAASALIQGDYDKIEQVVASAFALKKAINDSNHVAKVTINGKEVTVADAILMKASLPKQEFLLKNYRAHYAKILKEYETRSIEFEQRVNAIAQASLEPGSTAEQLAQIHPRVREEQIKLVQPTILDPMKIEQRIKDLEAHINAVKTELDYTLSTSNTQTMVEVEL